MEPDDPRTPLLGHAQPSRMRRIAGKLCSVQSWRRRLPITIWLPKYSFEFLLRDAIAGITVGLTSIPQGIAYAMIAGLPPQVAMLFSLFWIPGEVRLPCLIMTNKVGLYSSIFPGIVYALFGSCSVVTVGPTAILSALLAKYVAVSADFAYLATFLSGCFIMLLGVLQLGFLLDFISRPVISGFTTAAALQISASQLKSLFRVSGTSGGTFVGALINFFKNIKTVQPWDTLLGIASIVALLLLKRAVIRVSDTDRPFRIRMAAAWVYVVRARNAMVVFGSALLAYCLHLYGLTPFALTGKIEGGLPRFAPPPFSTTAHNRTLQFADMLSEFGAEGLVLPLVAILESIAIAKAFAGSVPVDATQEMIAIGAVNLLSSFCQSMPATGSFTRTALNHASGVATPAGSLFKASLVLLSVTLLSQSFYFIPRSTLAGVIVVAMASIIDLAIVPTLWRNAKVELLVYLVVVVCGASVGLEYGILCGVAFDAARTLAAAHRTVYITTLLKVGDRDCALVQLVGALSYASASRVCRVVRTDTDTPVVLLDGHLVRHIDIGVAENMVSEIQELAQKGRRCLLWNFTDQHRRLFVDIDPRVERSFVSGPSIDRHVLDLSVDVF